MLASPSRKPGDVKLIKLEQHHWMSALTVSNTDSPAWEWISPRTGSKHGLWAHNDRSELMLALEENFRLSKVGRAIRQGRAYILPWKSPLDEVDDIMVLRFTLPEASGSAGKHSGLIAPPCIRPVLIVLICNCSEACTVPQPEERT